MKFKEITIPCPLCGQVNRFSTKLFYDGYEGEFTCKNCGSPLEILEEALSEE